MRAYIPRIINVSQVYALRPKPFSCIAVPMNTNGQNGPQAEWLRPGDFRDTFGFSRSAIYALMANGDIKSANIIKPGKAYGTRLVNVQSVRDYIARYGSSMEAGK
jgi:hypothetical protein